MNDYENAKYKAIKFIGISKKTVKEVNDKLASLSFDKEIINKVVDFLKELEYINDEVYIKSFINQNLRFQKYSIKEIEVKLYKKGIDLNDYDKYKNMLIDNDYENKVVLKLLKTKLKDYDYIKRKAYLYRRGFKGGFNE